MEKLLKKYSKNYSSFRRKWASLYRPMKKAKFIEPTVIIMFLLFFISVIGFLLSIPYYIAPFMLGFSYVVISLIYFRFYPLTWEEMEDYEKKYFIELNKLPKNWTPYSK